MRRMWLGRKIVVVGLPPLAERYGSANIFALEIQPDFKSEHPKIKLDFIIIRHQKRTRREGVLTD